MPWLPSVPSALRLRLTNFSDDCSPYGRAVFYCAFFLRWECGLEGGRKWERKELTTERVFDKINTETGFDIVENERMEE